MPLPYNIRALTRADAAECARLHAAHMPHSVFARIGPEFLRGLYAATAEDACSFGFVQDAPSGLGAFITATESTSRLMRRTLAGRLLSLALPVARALLREPSIARDVFETFVYGRRTRHSARAEMLFITVDPGVREHGLAHRLIDLVLDEFRRRGVHEVKVTTNDDNPAVQRVLRDCGFNVASKFEFHGKPMLLFSRKL